jgi:hypothetical protein
MNIFVHRNGQQLGPFSESDIRAQLVSGAISPADLVWWDGQPGWIPLSQSPYAATTAPPIPPPPVPPITAGPRTTIPGASPKTSQLAIWALVCGVAEFFCGITFLPAIILGHLALSETKKNPALQGRGMAWAGLVLGYVYILLIAISLPVLMKSISMAEAQIRQQQSQQFTPDTNSPADNSTNSSDSNTPATNAAPANQ